MLQSEQPSYLHSLLNIQSYLCHHHSPTSAICSRLKITDRSFTHHPPVLWNSRPKQLQQPSAPPSCGTATDSSPLLALSSHQFHSRLKTFLFEQSFPPWPCLHQLLSVLWPPDLANVFISQSFSLCRSFSPRASTQCLWINLHQFYSCLAGFIQALLISPLTFTHNGQWGNNNNYYYSPGHITLSKMWRSPSCSPGHIPSLAQYSDSL